MLLMAELLFICLLIYLLIILFKNERLLGKKGLLHATLEECWDGKDRRKYARFKKILDVIYALNDKPHPKNKVMTIDVSEGGAKIVVDKKLNKDTILILRIELPDTKRFVEIEGKIVWSEEVKHGDPSGKRLFYAGVQFITVKEPAGKSFITYIRSLAEEC